MNRIEVKDIWVRFNVRFYRKQITFRSYIEQWIQDFRQSFTGGAGKAAASHQFFALRGISLSVEQGEVVGLIGHNGAGKSTLLMALAGIYKPNRGAVKINGRVGTLLSLGAGFDNELTGLENIKLYATLMGWDPDKEPEKIESIIEYADLEQFIDAPIRTYSSGMRARLGFSLASQLDPDILLMDEVFEAGDAAFKARTLNLIDHYRRQGKTIIFATHSLPRIRRFCTRAILLDHGRIVVDGAPDMVVDNYLTLVNEKLARSSRGGAAGKGSPVEVAVDARAELGEGPIWDSRLHRLWWVDILGKKIHQFDPATGTDRIRELDQFVGTVVPWQGTELIAGLKDGIAKIDFETGNVEMLATPEADKPGNRFNEGKCDPMGRFWAGTMPLDGDKDSGALYCMETDLTVRKKAEKITISNGLAWSLDHSQMYYIDTPTQEVHAFDYKRETGELTRRRAVVRVPLAMGAPDGMTIDADGMLWVALWGGGMVSRWDPKTGQLLQTISVPARNVSSCAFGGPDLEDLYITTARTQLGEEELSEQPLSGAVFRVKPGVRGVALPGFGG